MENIQIDQDYECAQNEIDFIFVIYAFTGCGIKSTCVYFNILKNLYVTTNHYSILESLKYNSHLLKIIAFN